ncbi:MAG: PD-(D/E)XK nuclease family protein, partial [Eubacterium sp.]|nr:PD-(D/E)XK nuclease family protein [Eubacterium sp.]
AERRLLNDLGEEGISAVDNSSFSRISNEVKREYGSDTIPVLSKGSKAVLMMQAIEKSKENLCLFNKKLDSSAFVNSMVKIYDEMKSCNLSSTEITELSKGIENETLLNKLTDISLIMSSYESIIAKRFLDPADELTRLYEKIKDKNYFKGKIVFIDGFNGFVAQEYKLLELVIKESECVTITLCTDSFDSDDRFNLFTYVNDSARILKKIAFKADVPYTTVVFDKNYRSKKSDILSLEKGLFAENDFTADSYNGDVTIYSSKNITDECCEVSRQIRKLLRSGYKASDITVITRDLEKYRAELSSAFKKYEIPFFNDERQPIKCQPLVVFIEYLLRCVNFSFRSDDILSLAKTGLTDIPDEDINKLENYVYLWNINGMKWTKPFENSTKGFVSEISESDRKRLDEINATRERLIAPLVKFKKAVKNANAQKICEQIYYTLISFNADEKIKEYAVSLSSSNCHALALQQGAIWDMVMEILSQLPITLGDENIALKDFAKLFSIVISTEDLGTLPGGIDNVQIGQADRIRTDNPKAVFVLGANEGEFPQVVTSGGLLSENDRRILLENDFKLYSYGEILNLQERYFAYMACTAPSEKIFISYLGNTGKDSSPSEIIVSIKNIFPEVREYSFSDISDIDLIETKKNAFDLMSEMYLVNNEFSSSLKKYFEKDKRFDSIRALAENDKVQIKNTDLATSLYNYNMYISASRLEDFYNCPFRYFCKFGLNARPRSKAEMDPMQRGTLIHYVLEMILASHGSKALSSMTDSEIKAMVDKYVSEYFENEMGNVSDVTIRFRYNYIRLSKLIYSVVIHLAHEFAESDFEAKAFELDIDKDGLVKPEVLTLDDGGTIQIRGSIDRVDTFTKNNQKYVRVVDYKSGNKAFNLSDIMYGLNLQMFVYLFSLSEDKSSEFCGIPSGVLYMHAARNVLSFDSRTQAETSYVKEENGSFKMKGIVISDFDGEIAMAMEHDLKGKYIPVKVKKNGDLSGNLTSLEELGKIHKKINSLIAQMGMDLHMGSIGRNPVKGKNHDATCDYCDYADVCANVKSIDNRIIDDLSDSEVKEILDKEYGDNAAVDQSAE